jgi:hypothetical protein
MYSVPNRLDGYYEWRPDRHHRRHPDLGLLPRPDDPQWRPVIVSDPQSEPAWTYTISCPE